MDDEVPTPQEITKPLESVILDTIAEAVFSTDANETITYWNHAAERLFGWPSAEVLGAPLSDIVNLTAVGDALELARDGHEVRRETELSCADGSQFDARLTVAPLWHENAFGGVVVVVDDLTEQVRVEHRLRQSQKLEAIGLLAGGIAHDFNNILTAMQINAELLTESPDSETREIAAELLEAVAHAGGLTRQLREFSRSRPSKLHVLCLAEAVRDSVAILVRLLPSNITLDLHLNDEQTYVKADPSQISQIVMNLVTNARDAIGERGTILVEVAHDADEVTLIVRDDGVGMDAATKAGAFEPLFSTKHNTGTGFGLATVKRIVTASGGRIALESTPGVGTTFEIRFPRVGQSTRAIATHEPTSDVHVTAHQIVVCEDNPAVQRLIRSVLMTAGYNVIVTSRGQEALEVFSDDQYQPDLLLTDIGLPDIDGLELFRRIRTAHPDLRVLFVSGYPQLEDDEPGATLLVKPFSQRELVQAVRHALAPIS